MKKLILNQKSYLFYDEMVKFKKEFDKLEPNNYEFILFPPVIYLSMFRDSKYKVGTQNFFSYKTGSFTGEINLESLKKMNINYTFVGHYERRKIIGETYEIFKEKLYKSLNSKCSTILLVGEQKKTRKPFNYIKKELNFYLKAIESSSLKYLSICYEPNWAIGSGEIQCVDKINKVVEEIKLYMYNKYKIKVDVYYGGSINKDNIKDIFNICDGVAIGKSSTEIDTLKEFVDILNKKDSDLK